MWRLVFIKEEQFCIIGQYDYATVIFELGGRSWLVITLIS